MDPELKGSFKGIDFYVERSDTKGGRRWVVHEYPRRDVPYAEDMGRSAKEWRLSFFVAGDDYDQWRNMLIDALDSPGAGTLVHPYLGTFRAVATDPRWRESTREGGICYFEVTFVESGEPDLPATAKDTQKDVRDKADKAEKSILEDFMDKWSLEGLTGWSLEAAELDVLKSVRGLEQVVDGVADAISGDIRSPANIGGTVIGGYNRLKNAVLRPVRAAGLYGALADMKSGDDEDDPNINIRLSPGTPTRASRMMRSMGTSEVEAIEPTTPERIQRAQNTTAANQLNGRSAALAASRLVAETEWSNRRDAEAAGADTLALIDYQMNTDEAISDDVYASLVALRAAVVEDLRTRAVALPGLVTFTPGATLPALFLAHRIYGDATRADEIVARNNVRHPAGVRGGMDLEVLSE